MRNTRVLMLFLLGLACHPTAKAMDPLDDAALESVDGHAGVQFILRLRNNVNAAGNPAGCSGALNPCRMGLEFSGRQGIWLMLKDYYGVLAINNIRLEGTTLPDSYTGHQNNTRFLSSQGTCLITDCDPRELQAVRISYPFSKGIGEYDDLNLLTNIGRVALEFNSGPTSGFMRDAATGSVLGFRMSDSSALNAHSRSRFDGTAYVFGF